VGAGSCSIYHYFDAKKRVWLGFLKESQLHGEQNVIFESNPIYQVETYNYTTMGTIS